MRLLVLFAALPVLTLQQCLGEDDNLAEGPKVMREILSKGQQQFSLNLLQEVNVRTKPTNNVFFSPFSIYKALLLTYFISANQTEAFIKKVLFIPERVNKSSVALEYNREKYFRRIAAPKSYELSYPNNMLVSNQLKVRKCMKSLFKNEITPVNFVTNSEGVVKRINAWVANKTKNQIQNLLKPGDISSNTKLSLVNAAFFKGKWKDQFQPKWTTKEVFYISTLQNATVPMMKHTARFPYLVSEEVGANILEMPYEGDDITMYVFLPHVGSPNGLQQLLERLTFENFNKIMETAFALKVVELHFPKFQIEEELIGLRESLETLGVGDLFQSTSDLSGLTGEPELEMDTVIHKAKVKVDEEGTTAAASTVIASSRSSRPLQPVQFKCNHPFFYLIYDKNSESILFLGVFRKPPLSSE